MAKKRAPAAIHSKKADHLGRTKDKRHGTEKWVTWIDMDRMRPAGRIGRAKRG